MLATEKDCVVSSTSSDAPGNNSTGLLQDQGGTAKSKGAGICDERPEETVLGPVQKSTRSSQSNTLTTEDEAASKETISTPQRLIRIQDRPTRRVRAEIYMINKDGAMVPWPYGKISDTTPENLLGEIARDKGLPSERVVNVKFSIPNATTERFVMVDRKSFQPAVALREMVTEFFRERKELKVCEVLAEPMVCEDVDGGLRMKD